MGFCVVLEPGCSLEIARRCERSHITGGVTQRGNYNQNVVKCAGISGRGALKGPLDSTSSVCSFNTHLSLSLPSLVRGQKQVNQQ